jgi:hypothetical protein
MFLFSTTSKIGGPNQTIEVDETCVVRRKYQVGRIAPTVWMVGGIVRSETFQMFLEIIPNRSAAVLEELISRNVEVGTTIITDKWGGYINLRRLGFDHKVINHSENFVDPNDSTIHTQRIESRWSAFKRFLRKKGTNYKNKLNEYMLEYLYRKTNANVFEAIITDISLQYPFEQ